MTMPMWTHEAVMVTTHGDVTPKQEASQWAMLETKRPESMRCEDGQRHDFNNYQSGDGYVCKHCNVYVSVRAGGRSLKQTVAALSKLGEKRIAKASKTAKRKVA